MCFSQFPVWNFSPLGQNFRVFPIGQSFKASTVSFLSFPLFYLPFSSIFEIIITSFSSSLFPSKSFHISLVAYFQIHVLFKLSDTTCIYIDIYLHLYIPKYNLLSLYNVMCVFRANYLVLDNQLVYSSLGKTISSILTQHSLVAVVLCIGLRPCRLPDVVISSGPSAHIPCLIFLRAEVWGKHA